jgi:hypothetical protein
VVDSATRRCSASISAGLLTARRGVLGEGDVKVAYARMQENYYTAPIFVVQPARIALQIVELAADGRERRASGDSRRRRRVRLGGCRATGAGSSAYLADGAPLPHQRWSRTTPTTISAARALDRRAAASTMVLDATHFEVTSAARPTARASSCARANVAAPSVVSRELWRGTDGESLAVRQSVLVTEPVRVVGDDVDAVVLLPWDVVGKHQTQLVGRGGSGHYEWRSASPAIATVNEQGVADRARAGPHARHASPTS